jgi:ATP-independent RNA helicase DbpA
VSAFAALGLPAPLVTALHADGLTDPTAVQADAIPPLLAGRDLRAMAPTGTGKTLAYGLPLLARLDVSPGVRALQALVLCPTRELATQVTGALRRAGRGLPGLRVLEVCGGAPGWRQRASLQLGVHVVVGTPGRCLDHLARGAMDASAIGMLVLDEADRMLDMGFSEDVGRIVAGLPRGQRAFFSATWPDAVRRLADEVLHDPVRVVVEGAPPELRHAALRASPEEREDTVRRLLHGTPDAATLVFVREKASADALAAHLREYGLDAAPIHGDLDQHARDRVLARLRNGSLRILVATDVAARGLDVHGLDLVVNAHPPASREAYVHRAGRTGRAGAPGSVVSIVTDRELPRLEEWVAGLGGALEAAELPPEPSVPASPPNTWATLVIHGGRRDKLRPGDVLGALTGPVEAGGAGLLGTDVGTIEIRDHVTFVAVLSPLAARARRALEAGRIKGRRMRVDRA